jgi:hypothetical protein
LPAILPAIRRSPTVIGSQIVAKSISSTRIIWHPEALTAQRQALQDEQRGRDAGSSRTVWAGSRRADVNWCSAAEGPFGWQCL